MPPASPITAGQPKSGKRGLPGPLHTQASLTHRLRRRFGRAVRILARRHYATAKAYYNRLTARRDRPYKGQLPLLVYTVGKVGSASVFHSLRRLDLARPVQHIHYLGHERLRYLEAILKPAFPESLPTLRHVWHSQQVAEAFARDPQARVQAITLVRDPIARNVSDFFQHIHVEPHRRLGSKWRVYSPLFGFEMVVGADEAGAPAPDARDIQVLIALFFAREEHDLPLLWLGNEIGTYLGINVYGSAFPIDKGYHIYHSERADVLLVRLRDLNRCATQAFQEFLGLDGFDLTHANIAELKAYTRLYRAFKAAIVFPDSYLDRMYNSAFARHFFTAQERQQLWARWANARRGEGRSVL
jgi:hypothetical protein